MVKLFVGNMNPKSRSADLRSLFEPFGKHMEKESDAERAIEKLQGVELDDMKINVERSKSKKSRGGGGGPMRRRDDRSRDSRRPRDYPPMPPPDRYGPPSWGRDPYYSVGPPRGRFDYPVEPHPYERSRSRDYGPPPYRREIPPRDPRDLTPPRGYDYTSDPYYDQPPRGDYEYNYGSYGGSSGGPSQYDKPDSAMFDGSSSRYSRESRGYSYGGR